MHHIILSHSNKHTEYGPHASLHVQLTCTNNVHTQMSEWESLFFFQPNATAGLEVQQQILFFALSHITWQPENTQSTFPSLCFPSHLSLCLASSLPHCLLLSVAAPPISTTTSPLLLSVNFSPLADALQPKQMSLECSHTAHSDGWQQPSMGLHVFFLLPLWECFFTSFPFPYAITYAHNISWSPQCLPASSFPLFGDIQSSASKLGYSMPLPNCPTARGSDRGS